MLYNFLLTAETAAAETTEEIETTAQSILLNGGDTNVGLSVLAYRIISIVIIIILTLIILFILRKIFRKYYIKDATKSNKRITKERVTVARIIHSVLNFVAIALAILSILGVLGVNVTAFIAGLGIVGAIGALSVQDLLKDLITGANIASDQYFAIGDTIEFENYKGTVTGLSMRSTKLLTLDGSEVTIQNHMINKVRKISRENKVIVPLSYELERKEAYALCDRLAEIIAAVPNVDSCKTSGIQEFASSSIDYALLFYCDPMKSGSTSRAVNVAIIDELDRSGISIPYNQLVIINSDNTDR